MSSFMLEAKWNIAQPIRVTPSRDPPNCRLVGGIGNRQLERL
jgi:hypothetical protein